MAVNNTTQNVVETSNIVGQIAERAKETKEIVNEIQEALKFIKYVSSQTNLLGLNALIESAHAGEYGRGFAVIAQEVRKLADQVQSKEKEIEKLIIGVSNMANENYDSISKLEDDVNQMAANLEEINACLEEVSATSQYNEAKT